MKNTIILHLSSLIALLVGLVRGVESLNKRILSSNSVEIGFHSLGNVAGLVVPFHSISFHSHSFKVQHQTPFVFIINSIQIFYLWFNSFKLWASANDFFPVGRKMSKKDSFFIFFIFVLFGCVISVR